MDTAIVLRLKIVNLHFKTLALRLMECENSCTKCVKCVAVFTNPKSDKLWCQHPHFFWLVTGEDFLCAASYDSESA